MSKLLAALYNETSVTTSAVSEQTLTTSCHLYLVSSGQNKGNLFSSALDWLSLIWCLIIHLWSLFLHIFFDWHSLRALVCVGTCRCWHSPAHNIPQIIFYTCTKSDNVLPVFRFGNYTLGCGSLLARQLCPPKDWWKLYRDDKSTRSACS